MTWSLTHLVRQPTTSQSPSNSCLKNMVQLSSDMILIKNFQQPVSRWFWRFFLDQDSSVFLTSLWPGDLLMPHSGPLLVTLFSHLCIVHHALETLSALMALCVGNPLVTGGFPSQRASNAVIILCKWQANERQHYNVILSLIGWAHTQNDPW